MSEKNREETTTQPVTKGKAADPRTERQLVEAVQNGDGKAYGVLVRMHQKRLFRFIYGLTRQFDQTEDIVQEAFVKAFEAIKTFRSDMSFYPWLATIARNLTFNQLHRMERQESLEKLEEAGWEMASPEAGPFERLLSDEAQKRFFQAVLELPTQYRSVFVCRHFEDMNYVDIASFLKIPPGTVDSRLHRARQMLVEKLKDLL